ncbi:hypothetical protein BGW38_009091, partial [Lunasporangiospora selenospora]
FLGLAYSCTLHSRHCCCSLCLHHDLHHLTRHFSPTSCHQARRLSSHNGCRRGQHFHDLSLANASLWRNRGHIRVPLQV